MENRLLISDDAANLEDQHLNVKKCVLCVLTCLFSNLHCRNSFLVLYSGVGMISMYFAMEINSDVVYINTCILIHFVFRQ